MQLAAPAWKLRGNAILIESKDEIRKRLGASTDDADAAVLAWHKRADAVRRSTRARPLNPGDWARRQQGRMDGDLGRA